MHGPTVRLHLQTAVGNRAFEVPDRRSVSFKGIWFAKGGPSCYEPTASANGKPFKGDQLLHHIYREGGYAREPYCMHV